MKKPYLLKNNPMFCMERGKKVKRIWEPSRGAMGIRLNTASNILMDTMKEAA